MELRVLVCVVLLAVQGRADSACTSGFPTLETVRDTAAGRDLPPLITDGFRVWLFPSMNFNCTGTISRWRFQAVGSGSGTMLPQMQVWRERTQTPQTEDYDLQSSSGTKDELRVIRDSVYEYVLTPPVAVSEGDVFGVLLPEATDRELLLQFQDFEFLGAPKSFLTPLTDNFLPTEGGQVVANFQYLPLVTAVLEEETVLPSATSTQVSSRSTIAASSIPATPSLPVATPSLSVSPTANPPTTGGDSGGSGGSNAGIVAAAVICSIVGVLVVCAVIVAIVIFVLKKRQPEIYEVKRRPDRMDNPVYTGVVSGVEDKRLTTKSTTSSGSYHIYAMPTQPLSPGGNREGVPQPNGTVEQHSIGDGLSGEHYEFSEGVQTLETHGYYQLEDMEASVKSATLASQYEVPVSTVSSTLSSEATREEPSKDHVYSVLEGGVYVPTEEQRKSMTASSNGSSIFDSSVYAHWGKVQKVKGQFFEQEAIYWKPASNRQALYDQLAKKRYREILKHQIQIIEHLGAGQFGTVNKGLWQAPEGAVDVAVKTLQPGTSEEDKVKFLQEAAIMGQFLHPNVVKLHGVVTVGEPTMIVLEFMPKGDLQNYLKTRRPQPGEMVTPDMPDLLLRFCREIASGMNYLANKAFVHRDLAARNILVAEDNTCKIGDFGMSRDLADNNYYITHGGKIPVRWTAPEALHFRKYSTASDVWSYGALMYEIWSLGHKPFEGYTNQQTMQLIGSGFRLPPPPGCPRPLYSLMIRCWHKDAGVRPTFSAIVKMLSHSHSHLMNWTVRDKKSHPQAACIGAPLSAGDELYPDLQDYYLDDQSKRQTT